jgi:PKD repeat protein
MHTDLTGWGSSSDYWQRYYPYDYAQNTDAFNAVVRTSDSGFAAAGITGSYHTDSGNDAFLIQIDRAGTTTGSGAYDGTVPKSAESIRQTRDGGYILAGSTMPSSSSEIRVLLIRLNPDLSVRWQRTFGNNHENGAFDVRQTTDGGFIVAGYTRDDADHRSIYLIRTDAEGNALFEVTPGSGLSSCEGRGVVQTSDGGFVVTGPSSGVYVAKVNAGGSTVWEQVYLSEYPLSDVASLEQTTDGGFLIGGTRLEPGELAAFQIMKLGPEIAVPQLLPLPGLSAVPTDPDGDGHYEDLNGNGAADFNDVVLFFTYLEWIGENEPISLFDFNGNGQVDFADITLLFEEL